VHPAVEHHGIEVGRQAGRAARGSDPRRR
jgi:hypothetical protein